MSPRAGFSILEMLVALALMALIAAGLGGALNLGMRVQGRSAAALEEVEPLALRVRLRGWLAAAVPPSRITRLPAAFEGTPERLAFTTLAPTPFAPEAAGLRVTVAFEGEALTVRLEPLGDDGAPLRTEVRRLAAEVRGGGLAFYDAEEDAWTDVWPAETAVLPALVRIRVEEGSVPPWPEMIVRPRLGP